MTAFTKEQKNYSFQYYCQKWYLCDACREKEVQGSDFIPLFCLDCRNQRNKIDKSLLIPKSIYEKMASQVTTRPLQ